MMTPAQTMPRSHSTSLSRRGFLKLGTLGAAGLGYSDILRLHAQAADEDETVTVEAKAQNVIMVWLAGGPSTIDMWDLKPDASDAVKGPFQPIDTSAEGIQISDKLPQMAAVMDRCTIIRSMAHSIPAHGPGTVYMNTGNKPSPALQYPSLGSLSSRLLMAPAEVPPYVIFGNDRNGGANGGYLGPAWNPFQVQNSNGRLEVRGVTLPEDVTLDELSDRVRLLETFDYRMSILDGVAEVAVGIDQFQQKALDILRSTRTRDAFNLNQESGETRQRYGNDGFGQSALAARRLVEAGVRFVTLGTGGWDTHGNNFNTLQNRLLPPIDRTVSALIADLDDRGLLDSTIVYVAGEFGRTPRINGNSGRDHWARSMAVVLAGGGLPAGMAFGTTNSEGMEPDENPCGPEDVSATILAALGVPATRTLKTRTGRPMQLFREGAPIDALLG